MVCFIVLFLLFFFFLLLLFYFSLVHTFNPNSCACECPNPNQCQAPFYLDQPTCMFFKFVLQHFFNILIFFFFNKILGNCMCNVTQLQCNECELPDLETCTCKIAVNESCVDRDLCNTDGNLIFFFQHFFFFSQHFFFLQTKKKGRCNASGVCVGIPKCPILDCQVSTCVPNVGSCTYNLFPNGTGNYFYLFLFFYF